MNLEELENLADEYNEAKSKAQEDALKLDDFKKVSFGVWLAITRHHRFRYDEDGSIPMLRIDEYNPMAVTGLKEALIVANKFMKGMK